MLKAGANKDYYATNHLYSIAWQRSQIAPERSSIGTSTKMMAKVLLQQMKGNPMPEHTD
jgi:hypothetical protein